MKFYLSLFLSLFFFQGFAQTQTPAHTKAAIMEIKKDLKRNNQQLSKELLNRYPITEINGNYHIGVLCKINVSFEKSSLEKEGFIIGAVAGNVISTQMPFSLFLNDFSHAAIDYFEVAERMDPFLDQAVLDVRADSVHNGINLPQGYTGKDVLVGIVDWGFEYVHPTFYDTSLSNLRVVAAWDQVKTGTPPSGFNYGHVYTNTTDLVAAEADTFSFVSDYHGTHVAGIAGGAGAGTPYRGIGFESDLIFTQMNGHANYSLDAYQWMFNQAQALGKRLVINNSFGSYRTNPLDGTSLFSQAMDAYSDSGIVFVVSAGNNGGVNFHLEKTFNADSVKTRVGGFAYSTDPDLWGQTISMWGEQGNNFSARIRILNSAGQQMVQTVLFNTNTALPFIDTFMMAGADTVFYRVTTDAIHPLNNCPQMTIDVKCENSTYKVILILEGNSGTVHAWNTRRTIYGGGNWGYSFSTYGSGYVNGDDSYGVGHPSVTNSVISVAAHTTFAGIASFSSQGPRVDGQMKPDLSAPGVNIGSSLNSFATGSFTPIATVNFNSKDYDFIRLSGTSMAGPMVTGIVSLILEANPNATPAQIKYILKNTTYEDSFTGSILAPGHVNWGMGKVDAYAAVNLSFTASVEQVSEIGLWSIYPNPSSQYLFIEGDLSTLLSIDIYSLDGKLVSQVETINGQLDISGLTTGIYLIQMSSGNSQEVFKLVKH